MSMHITGFHDNQAIPYAVKLGVALQLTNILRDVAEDWANGRCYLPQDELAYFGLTEADIAQKRNGRRWQAFMRFQIARTHQLYTEAMPGIGLLHRHGRFAVAAAADSLAINSGTWTIDPAQSTHILLGGVLPIEELLFFLLTTALVGGGVTLLLACESQQRLLSIRQAAGKYLPLSQA